MIVSLPTAYQQVIHKTRYARWREEDNRRENWDETVDRYMEYVTEAIKTVIQKWKERNEEQTNSNAGDDRQAKIS